MRMNQTEQFLGEPTEWPAAALQLHALQGLWGGRIITISGSGQVVVRLVSRGMEEQRYEWQMAATQTLFVLFIQHDFASLIIPTRLGVPDETLVQLSLTNSQGETITQAKWQNDSHPIFDTLTAALLNLESQTETLTPAFTGPYS